MAEVSITDEARRPGWDEYWYQCTAGAPTEDAFARGLAAAAPLIVAAELRRLADTIDDIPDPAGDAWLRAETAGRRDVRRTLIARAAELTGTHDQPAEPARRRLCLHADDDARPAHWLEPGETCPDSDRAGAHPHRGDN